MCDGCRGDVYTSSLPDSHPRVEIERYHAITVIRHYPATAGPAAVLSLSKVPAAHGFPGPRQLEVERMCHRVGGSQPRLPGHWFHAAGANAPVDHTQSFRR